MNCPVCGKEIEGLFGLFQAKVPAPAGSRGLPQVRVLPMILSDCGCGFARVEYGRPSDDGARMIKMETAEKKEDKK